MGQVHRRRLCVVVLVALLGAIGLESSSSAIAPPAMMQTATFVVSLPLILRGPSALPEPQVEAVPLGDVRYWAYQLQAITEAGAVDALVASHYDMMVLEPTRTDWSSDDRLFDTRDMVRRLQESKASDGVHRKLVIAYIDIAEAEDWRWYWTWSLDWNCVLPVPADWPSYILSCDPDGWTGNFPVAYWDARWRDLMIYGRNQNSAPYGDYASAIDEAIRDGFDGVYLDWVEAYEDVSVIAAAQSAGVDPTTDMIAFIGEMKDYARVRKPGFLVIQQNAAALGEGHPELLQVIDGIAQEGVWYYGDATDDWNDTGGYDIAHEASLTSYYIDQLQRYLDAGLPVFDCEYALGNAATAYANGYRQGYVPYVTRASLARLTTTTPPGYNE